MTFDFIVILYDKNVNLFSILINPVSITKLSKLAEKINLNRLKDFIILSYMNKDINNQTYRYRYVLSFFLLQLRIYLNQECLNFNLSKKQNKWLTSFNLPQLDSLL